MNRLIVFSALFATLSGGAPPPPAVAPLEVVIGPHKSVTFTFRQMSKQSMVEILALVATSGERNAALARALQNGGDITIVMTTAH